MKPKLTLLVGPPGSGKSSYAKSLNTYRISQDDMGKEMHLQLFHDALLKKLNVVIDRMGFNKEQRERYLSPARCAGYETEIVVFHEPYEICLERCLKREGHPTIINEENAKSALRTFFTKYERVEDIEADKVDRRWPFPSNIMSEAIICDLDGTLCNIDHRLHYVRDGKKNWKAFFAGLKDDEVNRWCYKIIHEMNDKYPIIYCSGRGEEQRNATLDWLNENGADIHEHLFMRWEKDYRPDDVIKQIILDFEIKTRCNVLFAIDDRKRVVEMWRKNGIVCLHCAEGNF